MNKFNNMDYLQFAKEKPQLYGQITVNGKSKIGSFKAQQNFESNSVTYNYHSPNGNKGIGGFTLMRAYKLLQEKKLSTNPADGKPENYLSFY